MTGPCSAGETEYYLARAFSEIYAPPSASLSLRGMSVAGTFLRGALEKVRAEDAPACSQRPWLDRRGVALHSIGLMVDLSGLA